MTDLPQGVVLERNRDLAGRGHHPYYRRLLPCLIGVLSVLALLSVFGQKPSTTTAYARWQDQLHPPPRLTVLEAVRWHAKARYR